MWVGDQGHTPAALPPGNAGGCVVSRAGLDECAKSLPHLDSIPVIIQPVSIRYIDYTIRSIHRKCIISSVKRYICVSVEMCAVPRISFVIVHDLFETLYSRSHFVITVNSSLRVRCTAVGMLSALFFNTCTSDGVPISINCVHSYLLVQCYAWSVYILVLSKLAGPQVSLSELD